MIIGLTGYAQSGKDSSADVLVKHYGFEKVSLAKPLKDLAYDIDPLIAPGLHLQELVDKSGWDATKVQYPEARRFLQRLGSEGIRAHVDNDHWCKLALHTINSNPRKNWAIPDMRFPNEYGFFKQHCEDIIVFRINRDSVVPKGIQHQSEQSFSSIPANFVIDNNTTLGDLEDRVLGVAKELGLK